MTPSETPNPLTLAQALTYTPRPLQFGTSGRRGDVLDLTQLEIYINARAELDYLQQQPTDQGGIRAGQTFFHAHDLRPSSTRFVTEQGGRGEIVQAVEQAIRDAGLQPVNLGAIPTPALTAYALARHCGSMMITGSHIPFHRNGYKTNSAHGELLKTDEAPIENYVARWRAQIYDTPFMHSPFDAAGRFKSGSHRLPAADPAAAREYLNRYLDYFGTDALRGLRVLVYQHSAVGRDLLAESLAGLGAQIVTVGRSEAFVPIDTEAVDDATLETIRALAADASRDGQRFDAVVSTDGDSDRPLLVGLTYAGADACSAQFYGGDLVGMLVAEFLGAQSVVVPISCNDAIERGPLAAVLEPRTRIGSPYVIAGMLAALENGARQVCGWEANGGFLTATSFAGPLKSLPALPTRDAFLPIVCVLRRMAADQVPMRALFDALPRRFSTAGLLRACPRAASQRVIDALSSAASQGDQAVPSPALSALLARYFTPDTGFSAVSKIDYTDGVRLYFSNRDIAHVRPSGNADELRIYAVADSQLRADAIVKEGLAEPAGILRRLLAEL